MNTVSEILFGIKVEVTLRYMQPKIKNAKLYSSKSFQLHIVILGGLWGRLSPESCLKIHLFATGLMNSSAGRRPNWSHIKFIVPYTLWQKSLLFAIARSLRPAPWISLWNRKWWTGVESSCQEIHPKVVALPILYFQTGINLTQSWTVLHIVHLTNGHEAQELLSALLKVDCFPSS